MTKKKETVVELLAMAIEGIASELSKEDSNLVASRVTLEAFRLQLQKMIADVESDDLRVSINRRSGMGRVIADSWPLAHPLGERILAAEMAYLRSGTEV